MRWLMAAYCSHISVADPASPAAAAPCAVQRLSNAAQSLPFSAWVACKHPHVCACQTFVLVNCSLQRVSSPRSIACASNALGT